MDDMGNASLIQDFVVESLEMIDEIEPHLVAISEGGGQEAPDDEEINTIFRLFHSMKGSAGFMNLAVVQRVAHEAENILSQVRQNQLTLTSERADLLIRTCDFLRTVMEQVQAQASDKGAEADSEDIIKELTAALEDLPEAPVAAPPAAPSLPSANDADGGHPSNPPPADTPVPAAASSADQTLRAVRDTLRGLQHDPAQPEAQATLRGHLQAFARWAQAAGYADCEALGRTLENIAACFLAGTLAASERHLSLLLKMTDVLEEAVLATDGTGPGDIPGLSVYLDLVQDTVGDPTVLAGVAEPAPPAPPPPAQAVQAPDGVLAQFISEARKLLDTADQGLRRLQQDGAQPGAPGDLLQLLHTFRGYCAVMGYEQPEALSQAAEAIVEKFRDGKLAVTSRHTDLLLHTVAVLRQAVGEMERTGRMEIQGLAVYVDLLQESVVGEEVAPGAPAESPPPTAAAPAAPAQPDPAEGGAPATGANVAQPQGAEAARDMTVGPGFVQQDIRVKVEKLNVLLDLVGELFIASSMVTHNPDVAGHQFEGFEKAAKQLNKITRELHEITMSVRMVPISAAFQKMRRVVHDLSRKSGKQIDLQILGEETEVDKTVIELVSDPLVHMLRNAVDHGLESEEERLAAGKPPRGTIRLTAKQEGGEVGITVQDDGRGLDRERILEKGIDRGLVRGNGADLRDEEVYGLIFEPGFSTAREVTNISGRGVGMDVVRRNLEKIHGKVDIKSTAGAGSRFVLRIPLTLAVVEGMLVRVGPNLYTIPTLAIRESMKVSRERVVTLMDGQEYIRVRKDMFPVLRLHKVHHITPTHEALTDGIILVLEHQGAVFCLFIDELMGMHQAVIKPLSNFLGKIRGLSGCAILGDGEVSLIVDIGSLLEAADFPEVEGAGWAEPATKGGAAQRGS